MKKFIVILGISVLAFGFSGCLKKSNNPTPQPSAAILFATLSPDAPHLNISVENNNAATDMPFGKYTQYGQVTPGTINIKVTSGSSTLISSDLAFEAGNYYSVFLIDSVSKLKVASIKDPLANISEDSVRVRFFNFSPNANNLDIAIHGGEVLSANRSFNDQLLNPDYTNFAGRKFGSYSIEAREAGTDNIVIQPVNFTLIGGGNYTIFIKGLAGETGEKALGIGILRHI